MEFDEKLFIKGMKNLVGQLEMIRKKLEPLEDCDGKNISEVAQRLNVSETMDVRPMYRTMEEAQEASTMQKEDPEKAMLMEQQIAVVERVEEKIERIFGEL